jgi:endonuclease/exonuclease/phosphatase family metal-dependent hydrolase
MRDSEGVRLPSPCENTARLLFRSSTVEQAATGNGTPSAGITTLGGVQNTANGELREFPGITTGLTPESAKRSVAWAYLRPRDGGTPFLAVSLHTDNTKDAAHELDRVAIARALGAWTEAMNSVHDMDGAPVVLMADLNSFAKRQPQGAQRVLVDTGWIDSFTAPFKRNIRYSTINYSATRVTEAQGFPTRPALTKRTKANPTGAATRIDYIFVKGASVRPVSYEVVIRLDSKGAFVTDYQGSDHQMVKAIVTFQ